MCVMLQTPPPPLTSALRERGVVLRVREPEDAAFLKTVYMAYRWEELDPTGWPDTTKAAFLSDQYRMQTAHYDQHYPDAAYCVVEENGQKVGRLYVLFSAGDLRVMDIALMPEARGRGLGGALLDAVLRQAGALGADKVSIHVEQNNPARRLYARLGFTEIEARGPYTLMELDRSQRARACSSASNGII